MKEETEEIEDTNESANFWSDSRNYFADVLKLPRRGRRSNINEEKHTDTECRFRLNFRQERIVKQVCKEHGISVQDVGRKFFDEGLKLWINKGRDKFDLSNKVKKIYRETIEDSVLPISNQVSLLHDKLDSFADEIAGNFEAVLVGSEAATPPQNSGGNGMGKDMQTLIKMTREAMAQNELLVKMVGSILQMTADFQTGTGKDARFETDKFAKFMDEGREQARTDATTLIVETVNEKTQI